MRYLTLLLMILLLPFTYGATIHGNIYDSNLMPANGARIEINSVPKQTFIAKDGTYSFELNEGNYELKIFLKETNTNFFAEQNITILDQGDYILDFVLLPDLSEETDLLNNDIIIEEPDYQFNKRGYGFYFLALAIFIGSLVYLRFMIKKPVVLSNIDEVNDDLLPKVFEFIKSSGGRTTQKEIRIQFPYSEAKISLIISELESKNMIEKIKKGRGNIIVIKNG